MAGTKTALFVRKTPGGVFSVEDQSTTTGDRWWVHSGTGTDGAGYGTHPDSPCATIDYAIGLATASQGDRIYGMPGHNESITAATSLVIDKIGLEIIGLGRGANRPTLDFDNTAGSIEFDAASCRLSNFILKASIDDIVVAVNIDAHDCELDHCFFTWEDTGDEFIMSVDLSAFDRCHIHDNIFESENGSSAATRAILIVDTNESIIENNIFRGTWSDAAILGATTLSARMLIKDNVIYNSDTSNYGAIDGGAVNSTGQIVGNYITSLYSQAAAVAKTIRKCNFTFANNYFADTVAERAATAVPATSAT